MAKTLYEILIRFDEAGSFKGAHVVEMENGIPTIPRAIKAEDWPAVAAEVDAASLVRIGELEVVETKHAEIVAAAESDDLETIKAKVAEQKLSDKDRRRAQLQKELEDLDKPADIKGETLENIPTGKRPK